MTRKDYELIVEAIGTGLNHASWLNDNVTSSRSSFKGEDLRIARLVSKAIAVKLADRLERDNPRFNRSRFEAAVDEVVGPQLDPVTDTDEPSGYRPEGAALYTGTPGSGSICDHGYAFGCRACNPDE